MRKNALAPFALILVVPALAIFLVSSDHWRVQALRKIESAARRPVWFDNFSIRWDHGLGLGLKKVTIYTADQKAVQLQVDEITAVPHPASFFKKNVELASVSVKKKEGSFSRDASGRYALTGPQSPSADNIPVRELDLVLKNVSGKQPVPVSGTMAVFSRVNNLKVTGVWDPAAQNELQDARIEIDLSKIDLAELERHVPRLGALRIGMLRGTLVIEAERLVADRRRALENPVRVTWSGGELQSAHLKRAIGGIQVTAAASGNRVTHLEASADIGGGKLGLSGTAERANISPEIRFRLTAEGVSFENVIALTGKLKDRLKGDCALEVEGRTAGFTPAAWLGSLSAQGRARIENGTLAGIGVMKQIFESLPVQTPAGLESRYGGNDTEFQSAELSFEAGAFGLRSEDVHIQSEAFSADGILRLDRRLNVDAEFAVTVSRAISSEFFRHEPRIEEVLNARSDIQIPVHVHGPLTHPRVESGSVAVPAVPQEALEALRARGKL